jgi:hypothetical protein
MDLHERTHKILEHCFTEPLLTRTKEDNGASLRFLEDSHDLSYNTQRTGPQYISSKTKCVAYP